MLNLYVVYDKKAEESGPVFTAKNDAVAQRMYGEMVTREQVNPDEYLLIHVGTYNPELSVKEVYKIDMVTVDHYVLDVSAEVTE